MSSLQFIEFLIDHYKSQGMVLMLQYAEKLKEDFIKLQEKE